MRWWCCCPVLMVCVVTYTSYTVWNTQFVLSSSRKLCKAGSINVLTISYSTPINNIIHYISIVLVIAVGIVICCTCSCINTILHLNNTLTGSLHVFYMYYLNFHWYVHQRGKHTVAAVSVCPFVHPVPWTANNFKLMLEFK